MKYDTLSQGTTDLKKKGYDLDFNLKGETIFCPQTKAHYQPAEFEIIEAHRFEGITNPADNMVLYAIESHDGKKGLLVDGYGAYAEGISEELERKFKH